MSHYVFTVLLLFYLKYCCTRLGSPAILWVNASMLERLIESIPYASRNEYIMYHLGFEAKFRFASVKL